jgi:long-chain acyl-CoA synthetase
VEDVLSQHPAIEMIAIIGLSNPERPGSEIVKAYVTLKSEVQSERDIEALKKDIFDFAREKLTAYEVPKILEIRTDLPLTVVGKIDKKMLRRETPER